MTDTEFAQTQRAVQAFRNGLRTQAERPIFRPLDVATLVKDTPRSPRAGRWISAGVGVAAVAVAAALLVPGTFGGGAPFTAVPAQTPTVTSPPTGTWQPTAPSPLSPRRDAVAVWVDGSYLVIGGIGERPCTVEGDQENCPEGRWLADGARYDPVTDTWHRIADAPSGLGQLAGVTNPYPLVAVLDRTVYLLGTDATFGTDTMLAYDTAADSWESLPAPQESYTLMAGESMLVGFPWGRSGDDGVRYETFDPSSRRWSSHAAVVETPDSTVTVTGASVAGDRLVVAIASSTMGSAESMWIATIELSAEGEPGRPVVSEGAPVPDQRPSSVVVGGLVAWPRGALTAEGDPDPDGQRAWFLDPVAQEWTSVALPGDSSGLTGRIQGQARDWYLTTDTMVALRGQLYDPVAGAWSRVPELPVPGDDPIVVGGATSVLACYGYDTGVAAFADDCYLLWPSAAYLPGVEVAPASPGITAPVRPPTATPVGETPAIPTPPPTVPPPTADTPTPGDIPEAEPPSAEPPSEGPR